MVSTQSIYARGISPPKYRRQTLEIFDVYRNHGKAEYNLNLPLRPVSVLDKKWVHRSVGDLTADPDLINTHPRLQTDFYQELYCKYPQAFTRRRNAREAGHRLFNSRPHVRFEDEERLLEQRCRSSIDLLRHDNHMTNWDREVGPYIRNNQRECFTSVEPSEGSGSVLSLKQRLHLNSVTLNKLLNQKSPLRKKFEKDRMTYDSGTENEQSLEDYFLDKSRQRSRNRVKHRRVLQRRMNNNNNIKSSEFDRDSSHKRWLSKSVSPVGRNMYSLPVQTSENKNGTVDLNVNEVMRDSDLKIDTFLDKIGSRLPGPDSPPDSAIDMDTPSVQSLVSNDKVMSSDNLYHVNIDLSGDEKLKDFYDKLSPENNKNMHENGELLSNESSAIMENHAMNMGHSISQESQIIVSELPDDSADENIEQFSKLSPKVSLEGPGLLQLYTAELMPELSRFDNQLDSKHVNDQTTQELSKSPAEQIEVEEDIVRQSDAGLSEPTESCDSETSAQTCNDPGQLGHNIHGNLNNVCVSEQAEEDSEKRSGPIRPPRGRNKKREITDTSPPQTDQINVPKRSDVDTCILDEVQLDGMSHDLTGRHSSDNTDDTDVRLGIPKASINEAKIAEKYRRTRSPSPFVVRYRNFPVDRPKSAPLLGAEALEIKVIDIPLTDSNNCTETMHSNTQVTHKQPVDKTCQSKNIFKAYTNDINGIKHDDDIQNGHASEKLLDKGTVHKIIHVQNNENKILVSSSQIKQRNSNVMPKEKDNFVSSSADDLVEDVRTDVSKSHIKHTHKEILEHISQTSEPSLSFNGQFDPSESDLRVQAITSKRGVYKPSNNSPRTKENKIRLKSLLKSKKGSFSPAPIEMSVDDKLARFEDQPQKNCMPVHNDIVQYNNEIPYSYNCDTTNKQEFRNSERTQDTPHSSRFVRNYSDDDDDVDDDDRNVNKSESKADIHVFVHAEVEATNGDNMDDSETESDPQTVKSKSVNDQTQETKHFESKHKTLPEGTGNSASSQESLPRNTNIPPAKPARTKHKKLPADFNLSQYKIMPNGNEIQRNQPEFIRNGVKQDNQSSTGSLMQDERVSNQVKSQQKQNDEIEVIEPQTSNLAQSKALSASKGSLLGGFKSATKGKLKSLRKAMSLEKGMEKAGVMTFPDPNNQANSGSDNFSFPKMKKAPSLKSITSLFGRKKKKKGKLNSEETESSSAYGSCQSISSVHTGSSDGHQPVIMHQKPGTSTTKPSGKLQKINPDGTQVIQLVKPQTGSIGFFIAKGSAKYKNGIFISRFADSQPEKIFGGLLSVGDEILEVNGHFVQDLSQDDVYNIISASPIIVMKVFPFIARKDI